MRSRLFPMWIGTLTAILLSVSRGAEPSAPPGIEAPSGAFQEALALKVSPGRQDYSASVGQTAHTFVFRVTNVSPEEVTIFAANTSCGCSVARMPAKPWVLAPGATGDVEVQVDLTGKRGTLSKVATLDTLNGRKVLAMTIRIPEPSEEDAAATRAANAALAGANRQAVFAGDCASCHATPTIGLRGADLFAAACGICHTAEHRATMVPDLAAKTYSSDKDYWLGIVAQGKPGTLMPAFAQAAGGPLDADQIASLADYLSAEFGRKQSVAK